MLIRGTKAVQLAKGIVFIFIVRIIAGFLHLNALTYIVDQIVFRNKNIDQKFPRYVRI